MARVLLRLTLAAAFLGAAAGPSLAQGILDRGEVTEKIEEAYPVRVLKIEPGEVDGQAVWMVTVMNDGGDFNSAFAVNTLAVDPSSGELVPAFRHNESGYEKGALIGGGDRDSQNPARARSGVWR